MAKVARALTGRDVDAPVMNGVTPLMAAAMHDRAGVIRYLVTERKAKLDLAVAGDAPGIIGATALFYAVFNDRIGAANCLVELKADANLVCQHGLSPLHEAAVRGKVDCGVFLW